MHPRCLVAWYLHANQNLSTYMGVSSGLPWGVLPAVLDVTIPESCISRLTVQGWHWS